MKLKVEEAGLTLLNGCRRCGEDFRSLRAFDAHHVNEGSVLTCLHPTELGLVEDDKGRWFDPERAEAAREHFSGVSDE